RPARASSVFRNWFRCERRIDDGENCEMTAKFKMVELPSEQPDQAAARSELLVPAGADRKPETAEWLWPGRVALGKLTLITGEAGLGKSQLSIAMAAAVTTGGSWPCDEGQAPIGNTIILSAEDGAADTVVPRLMAAGADRERVELVSAVRDQTSRRSFDLSADLTLLEQRISNIGDVRLIIIDPISSYLRDGSVVSSLHCLNDPQAEGHMASHIGRRKFLATLGGVAARGARAAGRAGAAHRRAHPARRGRSGRTEPRRSVRAGAAAIGLDH